MAQRRTTGTQTTGWVSISYWVIVVLLIINVMTTVSLFLRVQEMQVVLDQVRSATGHGVMKITVDQDGNLWGAIKFQGKIDNPQGLDESILHAIMERLQRAVPEAPNPQNSRLRPARLPRFVPAVNEY